MEPTRIVHISVGGPLRVMPMPSGKCITFEDHRIFGPCAVYPNGEPRKNQIRPNSPFWDRYEAWVRAGKPTDGPKGDRCIVAELAAESAQQKGEGE